MSERVRLASVNKNVKKSPTHVGNCGTMEAVLNPLTSIESAAKVFETVVTFDVVTSVFVTSVVTLNRYVRK
jgi:hypothetical protein